MAGELIPPPGFKGELVSKDRVAEPWFIRWVNLVLLPRVQAQAPVDVAVKLTAQAAAIGTTSLVALANAGLYRVSWYLRITTAAGVSSSAQLTILSTDGGVAISQIAAAVTGNTTATVQSGAYLLRADGASPISYSVAYASNPAAAMQFALDLALEAVAP